jgi:DNA-binding GntR family transcriptional regulator
VTNPATPGDGRPSSTVTEDGPVSDRIYRDLRDRIVAGEISPGTRLSVPALAQEYRVSRSPVREAVLRLVQSGIARQSLNAGAVVAPIDLGELVGVYEAREGLEWAAARLAAARRERGLRRRLLEILTEHEQVAAAGDFARHVALDAAFHRAVRRAADSPLLETMLDDIEDRVVIAMRSTSVSGGMQQAVADHRRIFEAVSAGDIEAAGAAASEHIARLTTLLRTGVRSNR